MDIKEIRIGNKVVWEGEIKTIDGIKIDRQYGISAMQFLEDCKESPYIENRKWYAMDRLSSIPLTEEWLIRMEFKKWNEGEPDYFIQGKLWFKLEKTGEFYSWAHEYSPIVNEIKFVHQVQNLYFALTGEELTIK